MFAEAVVDVAKAASGEDAVGAPAASPQVLAGAVVDDAVADTVLALSGGRSEPEIVANAWFVATLSGAIAKSK